LLVDPDSVALDLDACVSASLAAGGSLLPTQRELLSSTVGALRQRMQPELGHDDSRAYYRAFSLLKVTRHVETAADTT
jgi:hypothetical protein